jgi:lysozyme
MIGMQTRNPTNSRAIDISSAQGAGFDFQKAVSAGIKICYIKASEGLSYANPYLKVQYQGAKAAGLSVGFYHYFQPAEDPTAQASWFLTCIEGHPFDCLPVLDVEINGGLKTGPLSEGAASCLNEIQYLLGQIPVIYTYTAFIQQLQASFLAQYPLWIADYNGRPAPGYNHIWGIWIGDQYSDSGSIGGATVDLDEFTTSIYVGGAS